MTVEKVVIGDATLYCGDSTEWKEYQGEAVTIADPPYMLGAISSGSKKTKSGTLYDLLNFASWYSSWIGPFSNLGPVCVFGNWRSIPVYEAAFVRSGCRTFSNIIWDKEWIGPGPYFRPRYECIMVGGKKPPTISPRSIPDVMRFKWLAAHSGRHNHPAEKPVELLMQLIEALSCPGQVIIDPFMGSGTTGVAACCHIARQEFPYAGPKCRAYIYEPGADAPEAYQ